MENECSDCQKPRTLCVCSSIVPVLTRTRVLILQHPQEPDKLLGSAGIARLVLSTSQLRVGLSWPNLEAALGEKTDRARWAVLYLGSVKASAAEERSSSVIYSVNKRKQLLPVTPSETAIAGLVVLDGNWSQAKTLWWRNPWLLKLKRLVLFPQSISLYGNLRREPRKESLSTIESLAIVLSTLESNNSIGDALLDPFKRLLSAYRSEQRPAARDR